MKNVQVIDGAENCEYAIFSFEEDQFSMLFPAVDQDVEFIEDIVDRLSKEDLIKAFKGVWGRKVNKKEVVGIDGTLFYELKSKERFYPNKRDSDIEGR